MGGEVVPGNLDLPARYELVDLVDHEVCLQRVGVVKVHRRPLLDGEVGEVAVVTVMLEDQSLDTPDLGEDGLGNGGLSGTTSSGYANDKGLTGHIEEKLLHFSGSVNEKGGL